ncbi:MAG: transcriptional regulator [Clostridia bacterium]|nr:transcriptional regulator [Clostridia bacterium]
MEDKERKIQLYEIYKEILTANMQDVFEQYYFSDLSLREIAANNEISFQAVRDTLKKVEKQLMDMETKIGMLALKEQIQKLNEYVSSPNMDKEELINKVKKLGE